MRRPLADLVEATGAKAPTLYAEFVNKEGLFRAVLDRYISRFAAKHEALLFAEEKIRRSGVARLLHRRRHLLYQQRDAGRLLYDQYLRRAGGLLDRYRQYH
jgi:AcrR family transcriptional regulator